MRFLLCPIKQILKFVVYLCYLECECELINKVEVRVLASEGNRDIKKCFIVMDYEKILVNERRDINKGIYELLILV